MKQPELGKRIADLRQTQGLTQEELVERCNINVRTIQRIEAGEVTPRSYTVRTIIEALGASFDELTQNDESPSFKKIKNATLAGIVGGIAFLLTGIPEGIMDYVRLSGDELGMGNMEPPLPLYVSVKLISLLAVAVYMLAFYQVGRVIQQRLLQIGSLAILVIFVSLASYDLITLLSPTWSTDLETLVFIELVAFALGGVLFGTGLIVSRKQLGDLAVFAGIGELVMAGCMGTIFLAILALFFLVPVVVLEVILLYRIYKKG